MKNDILELMPPPVFDTVRAPAWTRLTRQEAQARSALAQRAHSGRATWGGREWVVQFIPLPMPGAPDADEGEWRIRLQWGGAPFVLAVPAGAVQVWIEARYPGLDIPSLPDAFVAPLLEAAGAQLADSLEVVRKGQVTVEGIDRGGAIPGELRHLFLLEAVNGDRVIHARLATSSLGLMLAAGLVARLAPAPNTLQGDDLPVTLRLEIGRTGLGVAELASLRPGDAVLIEHVFLTPEGELQLCSDGGGLRVRCDGACLTVVQAFTRGGLAMVEEGDVPAAGDIEQLPLQVSFDLGQRSMTLAQVRTLQPGQVIDLEQPLASAVNLRVNGVLVGKGELVEIDGRLGVVVASLFAPASSHVQASAAPEERAAE